MFEKQCSFKSPECEVLILLTFSQYQCKVPCSYFVCSGKSNDSIIKNLNPILQRKKKNWILVFKLILWGMFLIFLPSHPSPKVPVCCVVNCLLEKATGVLLEMHICFCSIFTVSLLHHLLLSKNFIGRNKSVPSQNCP